MGSGSSGRRGVETKGSACDLPGGGYKDLHEACTAVAETLRLVFFGEMEVGADQELA